MIPHHSISDNSEGIMNAASGLTHGGFACAMFCWGLSLGDLSVIVSMLVSVTGLGIQLYMASRKIRRDREEDDHRRRHHNDYREYDDESE